MADIDNVSSGLDKQDVGELLAYVQGDSADVPKALDRLMTNLYQKIVTVSGYSVASEVGRQAKLTKFLAQVEDELFDENMLATMSHEDLLDLHKRVADEANRSQESTRKWLQQNRDTFQGKKTEIEVLAQQLSTLPPDKLSTIKKILQGESLIATEGDSSGDVDI